jgi:hypothetical protein
MAFDPSSPGPLKRAKARHHYKMASGQGRPVALVVGGILCVCVVLAPFVGTNGGTGGSPTPRVAPATASPGNAYPASVQTTYIQGCEQDGATATECACAIARFEVSVSLKTFATEVIAVGDGNTDYPQWLVNAQAACGS